MDAGRFPINSETPFSKESSTSVDKTQQKRVDIGGSRHSLSFKPLDKMTHNVVPQGLGKSTRTNPLKGTKNLGAKIAKKFESFANAILGKIKPKEYSPAVKELKTYANQLLKLSKKQLLSDKEINEAITKFKDAVKSEPDSYNAKAINNAKNAILKAYSNNKEIRDREIGDLIVKRDYTSKQPNLSNELREEISKDLGRLEGLNKLQENYNDFKALDDYLESLKPEKPEEPNEFLSLNMQSLFFNRYDFSLDTTEGEIQDKISVFREGHITPKNFTNIIRQDTNNIDKFDSKMHVDDKEKLFLKQVYILGLCSGMIEDKEFAIKCSQDDVKIFEELAAKCRSSNTPNIEPYIEQLEIGIDNLKQSMGG